MPLGNRLRDSAAKSGIEKCAIAVVGVPVATGAP